jgi:CSLREA domain-containing protein
VRRLALLTAVAAALALPSTAAATDFSVTTLADLDGAVCGTPCSLRQAINAANTSVSIDGSTDVIHLPAGTLARNPAFQAVKVTAAVVIVGTGARTTTIAGSPNPGFGSRALSVASSSPIDVELRDLSVAAGLVEASATMPAEGGGIHVTGAHLTLRRVTVRDNQALDARGAAVPGTAAGGGIFTTNGSLTLEHVTIRDNRATGTWASGNSVSASGGGASVRGAGTSIRNTTVAGNVAAGGPGLGSGGGLELLARARLEGVTVTGNRVGGVKGSTGGNIASVSIFPVTVSGSIIADGRGGVSCARPLTSGGGNLEDAGQCGFTSASDRAMTDPRLGSLQDNGGPTDTRALLAGSQAIDLDPVCAVDVDQRGTARPQGSACDAGAFELVPARLPGSPAPPMAAPAPQRCTLGLAGNTRHLRARIVCNLAATVRMTGRATIRPRRARGATRHVTLRGRTISVTAGTTAVVRIAVPRKAIRAVRRKAKVTVALTATQTGSRQTARIARLKGARRKRGRRHSASSSAARAPSRKARRWTPIGSGGMNISDQVGLARTADRALHVAWRRRSAGQDLLQTPVAPSGLVGSPVTVVSGWAGVGSPALVARGRALSAFFPGSATLTTGDPTYGLDLATSADAGASWSVSPTAIARNEFAFARTPAAVLTAGGTYLQSWYGTDATVVHAGLDPGAPAVGGYGAGTNQALAASNDGQAMVAWCDGAVSLARVDTATGTRIGGIVSLPDSGRCGADTRVALASNGDSARKSGAGEPYFFAAVSSADGRKVKLFVIAGGAVVATSTVAAGSSFKQQITIATENRAKGSVWVCWRDNDANALACRRYSNPSLPFTFGAKVVVRLPSGHTITQLALDAQDDRVDAVATMADDENVVVLSATQVFPGLTLEGGKASKLARRGFRVLDNGQPIRGASVRVAGRTLTTNARGYARIRLRRGRYKATVSKPRYVNASVRVRIA